MKDLANSPIATEGLDGEYSTGGVGNTSGRGSLALGGRGTRGFGTTLKL